MTDIKTLTQLKGRVIDSSYYLAYCTVCDKIYPSNELAGGEAIADTGDYGECYCPHCGAEDSEIDDCTDAERVWNYQQENIDALVEALESRADTVTLPAINDDLIAILGRPNFMCAHLAELLRKSGTDIKRKSEHEQAAVIHWFLGLYLEHGDKWEIVAKADIQARAAGIQVIEGEQRNG